MTTIRFHRHLSLPGLLSTAAGVFEQVPDPVRHRRLNPEDCLPSGIAVFLSRLPPLLQFDQKSLFNVAKAPSNTCLREYPGRIDPIHLRPAFGAVPVSACNVRRPWNISPPRTATAVPKGSIVPPAVPGTTGTEPQPTDTG